MLNQDDWLPLARKLDWKFSYTTEEEVFSNVQGLAAPWIKRSEDSRSGSSARAPASKNTLGGRVRFPGELETVMPAFKGAIRLTRRSDVAVPVWFPDSRRERVGERLSRRLTGTCFRSGGCPANMRS
jgi:hypothetical protein